MGVPLRLHYLYFENQLQIPCLKALQLLPEGRLALASSHRVDLPTGALSKKYQLPELVCVCSPLGW